MNIYNKIVEYAPEKRNYLFLSIFFGVMSSILLVLPFWYLWLFLMEILNGNAGKAINYSVYIVVLFMGYILAYFLSLWCSHLLAFRLESNFRKKGISNLLNASFTFFDLNLSGKIRKLIDDNAVQTHMIIAHLIPDLVVAVTVPLFMLLLVFYIDIKLGVLIILFLLIGIGQLASMMGEKKFMEIYMNSLDKMNAEAVEYVRGMQVIKIFGASIDSFKNFYNTVADYSRYAFDYSKSCRTPYVMFQITFNIIVAITIPFAIYYLNNNADVNLIIAKLIIFACFSGALFGCFMRIMYVSMYDFQAKKVISSLENLFEDMKNKKVKYGNVKEFKNFDIEFENVSFKYEEDYVLQNLNLTLKEKRTYALVGPSGSGKSTIAKLISSFYPVNDGKIKIGGREISEYDKEAVMDNIAFVFQNSKLFKKTIYENVLLGNKNASYEEVMKALKDARCDDILDKFATRENTMIGAKGVYLSGGEVQRIAIARAILKNASIIILDEASAATDPENEFELQRAFSQLMKDKTVIMIAHRLSSIKNVDEILFVENGEIIERGSHEELMKLNGRYKDLQDQFEKANDWRIYDK